MMLAIVFAGSAIAPLRVEAGSGPKVRDHRENKQPTWQPKGDSKPVVRDHRNDWKPKPEPKWPHPHYPH
jgi:hypothetical protein